MIQSCKCAEGTASAKCYRTSTNEWDGEPVRSTPFLGDK